MWLFAFSSLIVLFFVILSCCSFDKMFFKISRLLTGFFKILESCIQVSSTAGDIQEWWSYGVWDFDEPTFWPAYFFLFHNFWITSIRFFANCNITLVFRYKPLPFRCALDKTLSIRSISKSFNCLLTSSIVTFPAVVPDLIIGFDKIIFAFGNFWDMNNLSFNMLFTTSDELQKEASFVPTCNITSPVSRHDLFGQVCALIL